MTDERLDAAATALISRLNRLLASIPDDPSYSPLPRNENGQRETCPLCAYLSTAKHAYCPYHPKDESKDGDIDDNS